MMKESKTLEFKADQHSKTWLKTVSAFANYSDGSILFGVADDGTIAAIPDPVRVALDIENRLNDCIDPQPQYEIYVDEESGIIRLRVFRGKDTPYFYRGKAYRRNDTSTIEVNRSELKRLILRGENLEFGDLAFADLKPEFSCFRKIWESCRPTPLDATTLSNLNLSTESGQFTQTAALLSDTNPFPGITVAQFGSSINILERRKNFSGTSVLEEFEQVISFLTDLLSYEEISGYPERTLCTRIPPVALRETLINAIAHRDWMIRDEIKICLYSDRLIITSPGGLPEGISEEQYLSSMSSVVRNTSLTWILLQIRWIEKLGTGTQRIREAYQRTGRKPSFRFFTHAIEVTLPFTDRQPELSVRESRILDCLSVQENASRPFIEHRVGCSQATVTRLLNDLIDKGLVEKTGAARSTRYRKV